MLTAHTAIVFFSTVSQSILISLTTQWYLYCDLIMSIYLVVEFTGIMATNRSTYLSVNKKSQSFTTHTQQFPIVQMHTTARANLVEQEHDVLS